ncbi:MAG: Ivy family c-type lysozyme inhibitor [Pseudomonadota bacterium]
MKFRTTVLFSYVIIGAIAFASSEAIAEPYLFELLSKPTYYKSWNALFVGEEDIDTWLVRYAKTKNGPATPGKVIQLGKSGYQVNMVCKTHECGENQFFVLFTQNGTKAWGLLLKHRKTERFFGSPDDEKKNALRAAAYE